MSTSMYPISLVFFGSFQHYSTLVLEALTKHEHISVDLVISTPPRPAGKDQTLKATHTHTWALEHNLPVFTPDSLNHQALDQITNTIIKNHKRSPAFFLSAGYSLKLPKSWLTHPIHGSLNLHFSLLPKFRGGNPAEWAILLGEQTTGNTLMTMAPEFDTGHIISQSQVNISPQDTRVSLYQKLYQLGADTICQQVLSYYQWLHKADFACQSPLSPRPQPLESPTPFAYMFKREHGYIPWQIIQAVQKGKNFDTSELTGHVATAATFLNLSETRQKILFIERSIRALYDYPGVWTTVSTQKGTKRLKIHTAHLESGHLVLDQIQLEGRPRQQYRDILPTLVL